ncbi:diol dehydratase small subunit [Cellulosilyticum sp. I15G10I2]|uniref:diol dehydratase small subunit n=1 Tax=Cellulosilyticum sp. I15G10I2 TaxID=1892843 RepID=UPI00085C464D|nr:diol dehydratase small subunit [Cellulosilyticum sp. I15G10I2]
MDLYPLIEKYPELIASKTGKKLEDVTIENIMNGSIGIDDISISKSTLMLQAKVALEDGKTQLAENFVRAAELIAVPDDEILQIYNSLRPYRATETELQNIADKLEAKYDAPICANFIRETLEVHKKRDILRKE